VTAVSRPSVRTAFRGLLVLAVLAGSLALGSSTGSAYDGAPWFEPSKPYDANFPDPSVVWDAAGRRFVAYATPTGGAYLPAMTSTDARTWVARPAYEQPACVPGPRDRYFNDALPCPSAWAPDIFGGRMSKDLQAPGVARIGGRWVAFYAVRERTDRERFCLAVATSTDPLGPFHDVRHGPLHCDDDPNGSLDPAPVVDPVTGQPHLVWKSEGVPGSAPTRIWSRPLDAAGTSFAPGSQRSLLLQTSQGWEGNVIENPSLIHHGGRWLLFYSGNEWTTAEYATGVAFCDGPQGPCHKSPHNPVLRSHGSILGPGGADAFAGDDGILRLAYHHWTHPHVGYPSDPGCDGTDPATGAPLCASQGQRRMRTAFVQVHPDRVTFTDTPPVVVTARSIDDACPSSLQPVVFDDDPGPPHGRAIGCVAAWGIAEGTGGNRYSPSGLVTRGQMATFLARLVDEGSRPLPDDPPDAFRDDDGSTHEPNINRLAAAGIVTGVGDGRYDPRGPVLRDQMATFLARTAAWVRDGQQLPAGQPAFGDLAGSVHAANIDAAAGVGIATGVRPGVYAPRDPVTRAQMASFLARLLDLLVDEGRLAPPG
jgi:hypothetical protein